MRRDDVLFISGSNAPENFTGVIKNFRPDILFIIDAARMGLKQGECMVLQESEIGGVSFSTHMLPLSVFISYLKSETGCGVVLVGIQPGCTDVGFRMCRAVRKGTEKLAGTFYEAFQSGE
jgi:hydrogenase 3 maturation protease